jgi:hypothetical protein
VANPSPDAITLRIIKECTLERNFMCVSSDGKPSLDPVTFRNIKESTVEKNLCM